MSKTIDQRVVSMEFDNKNFESNAKTSMNTLDQLKEKLNFTGVSKGADTLSSAVKKVDVSSIGRGVEEVHAKFSALEVMGVTALANITNSAVNAGKKIASALTIDPIKSGLSEYETQINAVQTILANTQSKGTTLDQVNEALDTLNTYADKTIYNFTEMTKNIGTFTAAGVDLDTSVSAIQGIANLAAISGSTSQQASTAMYQLSQALATGTVKLMDWNSVVNAGMGGEVFQNAIMETARVHGVAIDDMIESEGSFRDTLSSGWLTSEILTETLEKFTMTTEGLTDAQIEANREMLRAKGYTEEQIDEIFKLGETATDAATKVKTFSQLWEVLKESAQSGWAKTWQILIGDFEEAKSLLTPLATFLTDIIQKMSDFRNNLLEGALGTNFKKLAEKIKSALDPVEKSVDTAKKALESYDKIVNQIILGDWDNGQTRWDKLTQAGYDWAHAQNLVNEKLGDSTRHATDYTEAQEELTTTETELTKTQAKRLEKLIELSDAELKAKGYTEEQIEAFRELETTADKLGMSITDLVENIDEIDGRWLLIDSFKNIGQGIVAVLGAIKDAWTDIFPPMVSEQLFNIVAGFHKFSTHLVVGDETAENLKRTLKGLFAILDIILTVVGGPIKIAFKAITQLLGMFDLNILDVTAKIGDLLVKFRDWIDDTLDFTKVFEVLMPYIKQGAEAVRDWFAALKDSQFVNELVTYIKKAGPAIRDWFSALKESKAINDFIDYIKKAASAIGDWFDTLKDSDNVPRDIILGLVNGLKEGVSAVVNAVIEIGKGILEGIKGVLGIQSPSTEFFEIGQNIIAGLVNGIQNGAGLVWEAIKNLAMKCVEIVQGIDFGKLFAAGLSVALLLLVNKITDVVKMFAVPLEGLGAMFEGIGDMFEGIGASFKSKALLNKSKALLNIAIAVGILVASVALLTQLDTGKVWASIGAIAALSALIVGLAFISSKMGDISDIGKQSITLLAISASLLIMAIAMKKLADIEVEDAGTALILLAGMITALAVIMVTLGTFVKGKTAANIDKAGVTILKISVALLLMTYVIKQLAGISGSDINNALSTISLIGIIFTVFIAVSQYAGKYAAKAGTMLLLMSASMLIMVGVIKIAAKLDGEEVVRGIGVIALVGMLFAALVAVSSLAGPNAAKAGAMMLMMSLSFIAVVAAVKLIAGLDNNEIARGLSVISLIGVIFAALVAVSYLAGENAIKAGAMLLMVSGAFLILAGVLFIISKMDPDGLGRALTIVATLGMLFAGLIAVTKLANDCMGTLIVLTVAIAVLAGSIIALSLLDQEKVTNATLALTLAIGMFAALVACTSLLNKVPASALVALGVMTLLVAGLAGILWMMDSLDIKNSLTNAASLSLLLIVMSASLFLLSGIATTATQALIGIGLLTAMAIPLAAFIGVLVLMNYVDKATSNVQALVTLATVMTVLLIPLTLIGTMGPTALIGVGLLLAMAVPLVAFVGILLLMENCTNAVENVNALVKLVATMTVVLIALAIVGPLAMMGISALSSLSLFIAAVGVVAVAVGALMDKFPQLEEFLDRGIPILEKLCYAVGSFVGNLVGGFVSGALSGLPDIGTSLSQFMTNASTFIEGAKKIDEKVLAGVKSLGEAILILTAADFMADLMSFSPFGSSFAQLGTDLSEFMTNAEPFLTGAAAITPEMVSGIKNLAEAIMTLSTANFVDSISSLFGGSSSLSSFGTQLADLGTGLANFVTNLGTFTPEMATSVESAANVIKTLAEAAAAIPNEGGWLAKICGENSIATFGSQLPDVATYLSAFATNLGTFDDSKLETVKVACDAIQTLAEAADTIPNDGGLWGAICGENGLATFSAALPGLGTDLASFITNLGTFDETSLSTVKTACNAIKTLGEVASTLPNDGGLWGAICGENGLAKFSSQLPELGSNISSFMTNLGTLTDAQVASVSSAATVIRALSQVAKEDVDVDKISDLGKNLDTLAKKITAFAEKMAKVGTDSLDSAIDKIKTIVSEVSSIVSGDSDAISAFGDALNDLAKSGVDKFVEAFTGTASISEVKGAAGEMLDAFIEGVEDGLSDVKSAFEEVATGGAKAAKSDSVYSKAKSAGSYLVDGFTAGISANSYKAEAKARAMASAAVSAAQSELDINSPSKVFMKLGAGVVEGFVKGIYDNETASYRASSDMAKDTVKAFSYAVSKIQDVVNSDIDAQPTIRPVLDLSDIESGAGAISGMFTSGPSVGVSTNIEAINSMMNRNQNGVNDELVSAIHKLQKSLGNMGSTSYNINGITYDDGSNISDAVKSIVRAARVERRV